MGYVPPEAPRMIYNGPPPIQLTADTKAMHEGLQRARERLTTHDLLNIAKAQARPSHCQCCGAPGQYATCQYCGVPTWQGSK